MIKTSPCATATLGALLLVACRDEATRPSSGGVAEHGSPRHLFDRHFDEVVVDLASVDSAQEILADDETWIVDEILEPGAFGRRDIVHRQDGMAVWGARTRYQFRGGGFSPKALDLDSMRGAERGSADAPPVDLESLSSGAYVVDTRGVMAARPLADGPPRERLRVSYPVESNLVRESVMTPIPRTDAMPEPVPLALRGDTRRHLKLPEGSAVSWVAAVGAGAQLRFSYGLDGISLEAHPSGGIIVGRSAARDAQFFVDAELDSGERSRLWSEIVPRGRSGRFLEASVSLAAYSGQTIRLWLGTTRRDAPEAPLVFPFIAEPRVQVELARDPPNVIVLVLDTLRADRLGAYGYGRPTSPAIDALARESVLFERAWSAAPWTLPSHASLFSSLYLTEHGVSDSSKRLAPETYTLAEFMRDQGYATAALTESGYVRPEYGFDQGFDRFWCHGGDVELTFQQAREWVEATERPFFLFLHTYKVHSPHDPSPESRARLVRPYEGALPRAVHTADYPWAHRQGPPPPEADIRYMSDLYDAEIADLDAAIGDLVSWLEERGLFEDLVLLVTSDHGEEFGEHGYFTHGWSLYEEQLHVPLLVRAPGLSSLPPERRRNPRLALGLDVAPTIAGLIGCPPPESWTGIDLFAEPQSDERPMWVPYIRRDNLKPAAALREGDSKYIEFLEPSRPHDPNGGVMLFDLATDPAERLNLWETTLSERWQTAVDLCEARYPMRKAATQVDENEELLTTLKALGYGGD